MSLTYFINRKHTTCVITFKGSLTSSSPDFFDDCLKEATSLPTKYYVLNLGGVQEANSAIARAFTKFQQTLRGTNAKLFLCDVPIGIGAVLASEGVLRKAELCIDLMSCLQAILDEERGEKRK